MMKPRIACLFNYAPHYRKAIYQLMDREFGCHFYFGANLRNQTLEKMDVHSLKGFKRESKHLFFRYSWQCGYPWFSLHRYDVFILTGEPSLSNILLVLLAKAMGKRVYLWGHGLKSRKDRVHPLIKMFYRKATGLLLYGEYGKRIMTQWGMDPAKLHVIYNSLDYDQQIAVRAKLAPSDIYGNRFGNVCPTLIFVGRLTTTKGLPMLVHAVSNLQGRGVLVNAVLVGQGPDADALKALSSELHVAERVWFYGACYDEVQLGELLFNATACVSPGEIGLTAMHAMVYGCPVVTHNDFARQGPEYEAVTEEESGYFFEYGKQNDLEEAIIKTLALDRNKARLDCYRVLEEKFNPHVQLRTMCSVIYGEEQ